MRATWNGVTLAESKVTIVIEGNHYFPPESLHREYFRASDQHSTCPWKGHANYYDIVVDDKVNSGAAWYYPEPRPAAANIRGHVAFWRGVKIED